MEKKKFIIEVYELHCASFECEAETEKEAIEMWKKGKTDYVEDSAAFIEVASRYHGKRENEKNFPAGIRDITIEQEFDFENAKQIEDTDIVAEISKLGEWSDD